MSENQEKKLEQEVVTENRQSRILQKKAGWDEVLEAASGDIRRLSYADRYTTIPVSFKENVAEHSYWVSIYALLIHKEASGVDFYVGPILAYAVTHDLVECVTGDLVRTFKYSTARLKEAVDDAEEKVVEGLHPMVQDIMSYPWSIAQAPVDKAYVKAVVKAADFVSLHQYMIREVNRGNREIEPFYQRMKRDLKTEGEKFGSSTDTRVKSIKALFDVMAQRDTPGHYTT